MGQVDRLKHKLIQSTNTDQSLLVFGLASVQADAHLATLNRWFQCHCNTNLNPLFCHHLMKMKHLYSHSNNHSLHGYLAIFKSYPFPLFNQHKLFSLALTVGPEQCSDWWGVNSPCTALSRILNSLKTETLTEMRYFMRTVL